MRHRMTNYVTDTKQVGKINWMTECTYEYVHIYLTFDNTLRYKEHIAIVSSLKISSFSKAVSLMWFTLRHTFGAKSLHNFQGSKNNFGWWRRTSANAIENSSENKAWGMRCNYLGVSTKERRRAPKKQKTTIKANSHRKQRRKMRQNKAHNYIHKRTYLLKAKINNQDIVKRQFSELSQQS